MSGSLRREENVIVAEVDGNRTLLNLGSFTHLRLNETGERIWELLAETSAPAALLRRLAEEYDAPEDRLDADLKAFLALLTEQGFIAGDQ